MDNTGQTGTPPRRVSIVVLALLVLACACFSAFDLLHVHIWWSTAFTYAPSAAVFSFGLWGWVERSPTVLCRFAIVMCVIDALLLGYATLLCKQRSVWGPVTFCSGAFTSALTWAALQGSRYYKVLG